MCNIVFCSTQPVIATHSNAKGRCFVERNLTDQQIRAIASKDGLIGMNACCSFIHTEQQKQDALHLAKHAKYVADLVGVKHVNRVAMDITSKPPGTIEWE